MKTLTISERTIKGIIAILKHAKKQHKDNIAAIDYVLLKIRNIDDDLFNRLIALSNDEYECQLQIEEFINELN